MAMKTAMIMKMPSSKPPSAHRRLDHRQPAAEFTMNRAMTRSGQTPAYQIVGYSHVAGRQSEPWNMIKVPT